VDAALADSSLVLLVDDDRRTSFRLAQMLREDGFDVEVVTDGAAAIARLGRVPMPSMLVTDFQLAHADGLAVARYARSRNPRVHVVIATGYPELLRTGPGHLDPPLRVLTKPLDYDVLRAELAAVQAMR
jgi:two-component system response regulator MprA